MVKDPKMEGAPILRPTFCRFGTHTFIWSSGYDRQMDVLPFPIPSDVSIRCTCQRYTWKEWQEVHDESYGG